MSIYSNRHPLLAGKAYLEKEVSGQRTHRKVLNCQNYCRATLPEYSYSYTPVQQNNNCAYNFISIGTFPLQIDHSGKEAHMGVRKNMHMSPKAE